MKNEDLWNLEDYENFRKPIFDGDCTCEGCSGETCAIDDAEEQEVPNIYIDSEIVGLLAGVKATLMHLARNLETEEDIERTRDELIDLQEDIDRIVGAYAVSCVDKYILGL